MTKPKTKEQVLQRKVIFTLTLNDDGDLNAKLDFKPGLVGEKAFQKMSKAEKALNNLAADLGNYCLDKLGAA